MMSLEEKVELLNYLAFIHNKLTRLSVHLYVLGEDSTEVDKARAKIDKKIDQLRIKIAEEWVGAAADVMHELRSLNKAAQNTIRELDRTTDRTSKVAKVIGIFDKGLKLVESLVP